MAAKLEVCPVCSQPADFNVERFADSRETAYEGNCARCGIVRVTNDGISHLRDSGTLHLLSAFFRRQQGVPVLVTSANADELLAGLPVLRTVPDKMNGLLKLLVNSKVPPGTEIPFDPNSSYPLIYAANWQEASYLMGQLSRRGFVSQVGGTNRFQVTADGYERMEQLEASSYKSIRNAFVAMWFDKSRDLIYSEAIVPAIRDAGYQAVRIDKKEHINRIDDEIIAQLRQSRFLVADFTGQRNGVYYEAGFMHGLGRNVFWLVEKKELDNTHFDLRQYNFIGYESSADAKTRLRNRILAVEGKGPDAPVHI
jgi:hypothetical protein